MKRLFLDVDGTLIDKDDAPRPNLENILERLSKCFDCVYIWSGGGGDDYARIKLARLELEKYATAFFMKVGFDSFHIGEGDVCIDDERNVIENFYRRGAKGYWVPYYEPHVSDNKENTYALEEVCKRIENENQKEAV